VRSILLPSHSLCPSAHWASQNGPTLTPATFQCSAVCNWTSAMYCSPECVASWLIFAGQATAATVRPPPPWSMLAAARALAPAAPQTPAPATATTCSTRPSSRATRAGSATATRPTPASCTARPPSRSGLPGGALDQLWHQQMWFRSVPAFGCFAAALRRLVGQPRWTRPGSCGRVCVYSAA